MSLIICPECQKQISDKATNCPNCGYPIKELSQINTKCNIDNAIYDFSDVINLVKIGEYKEAFLKIRDACNMSFYNCINIIEYIQLTDSVPENYEIKKYSEDDEINAYRKIISMKNSGTKKTQNQVHCPYCNSTDVKKISSTKKAASIIGFGILSNKIGKQWHCNSCKSDF